LLFDARLFLLLLRADDELAAGARAEGCGVCGGVLHSARYPRKPRGGPPAALKADYSRRRSFCCANDDCRKRTTPPSLRFLGRRVYLGAIVVLASAMTGGVTLRRAAELNELVGVSIRTLQRWRSWWRETFAASPFWKAAKALFSPPADACGAPATLLERFAGSERERLFSFLEFLAPITTRPGSAMAG
jgi:hypothetical protein